jgi:PAS domain-containing protein
MSQDKHHEELINGIAAQMQMVLDKSSQAIYIYLDDVHKRCNKKFATMLGYKSPEEWADIDAPLADVLEEDQPAIIDAYMNASVKMIASTTEVRFKNVKTGKTAKARMTIAPIGYAGHIFTAHFFSKI